MVAARRDIAVTASGHSPKSLGATSSITGDIEMIRLLPPARRHMPLKDEEMIEATQPATYNSARRMQSLVSRHHITSRRFIRRKRCSRAIFSYFAAIFFHFSPSCYTSRAID